MNHHRLLPLVTALALTACAGKPVQTDQDQKILRETQAARSALVTAGCVTRNQFGDDLLLTDASARMAETIRTASLAHLAPAGVRSIKSVAALICPGHVTGESPGFVVKPNRDTEATAPAVYPIALDAAVKADAALAAAYDALFRATVQAAQPASGATGDAREPRLLAVTPRDLELIRRHTEADRLWLVSGNTGMVSFAKSFLAGMATGIGTALTFGVGYISQPVNASAYHLSLIDLASGKSLWRGQMIGPGQVDLSGEIRAPKPEQLSDWAAALYAPLIASPATTIAKADAAAPIAAPASVPAPAPASAAPSLPAKGQRWTLTRKASLRSNPRPDAPLVVELGVGQSAHLSASTPSPSGVWWYVQAEGKVGWIAATELSP